MSTYNPLPEPEFEEDESLSEEENDERYYRACDRVAAEARERLDPADWFNGRIDRLSLDHDDRDTLTNWVKEKIVDNDFQFPQAMTDMLLAWPPDSPLTEEELRREVEGLLAHMKALRRRAKELIDLLPRKSDHEEVYDFLPARPPSIYHELIAAIDFVLDPTLACYERYLERSLTETPETLAFKWLSDRPPKEIEDRVKAEIERRFPGGEV